MSVSARTLRELESRLEGTSPDRGSGERGETVATGLRALDRLLPRGGLPRGEATEWRGTRSCGKTAVLRRLVLRLVRSGEPTAIVDARRTLHAPDWRQTEEKGTRFWVVRCPDSGEAAGCVDLLLRSGAFGAVALVADGEERLVGSVAVRLQRLAEGAGALFVSTARVAVAGLRLRFRPGRLDPIRDVPFGPRLPPVRPLWVRVEGRGREEIPVLCPVPDRTAGSGERARDRKGRR